MTKSAIANKHAHGAKKMSSTSTLCSRKMCPKRTTSWHVSCSQSMCVQSLLSTSKILPRLTHPVTVHLARISASVEALSQKEVRGPARMLHLMSTLIVSQVLHGATVSHLRSIYNPTASTNSRSLWHQNKSNSINSSLMIKITVQTAAKNALRCTKAVWLNWPSIVSSWIISQVSTLINTTSTSKNIRLNYQKMQRKPWKLTRWIWKG